MRRILLPRKLFQIRLPIPAIESGRTHLLEHCYECKPAIKVFGLFRVGLSKF